MLRILVKTFSRLYLCLLLLLATIHVSYNRIYIFDVIYYNTSSNQTMYHGLMHAILTEEMTLVGELNRTLNQL